MTEDEKLQIIENSVKQVSTELHEYVRDARVRDEQVEDLKDKFDTHLLIYANNGKEMKRMNDIMEIHIKRMEPVYQAFQGLTWSKKALLWIVGALGSVVGLILAVKELTKK